MKNYAEVGSIATIDFRNIFCIPLSNFNYSNWPKRLKQFWQPRKFWLEAWISQNWQSLFCSSSLINCMKTSVKKSCNFGIVVNSKVPDFIGWLLIPFRSILRNRYKFPENMQNDSFYFKRSCCLVLVYTIDRWVLMSFFSCKYL